MLSARVASALFALCVMLVSVPTRAQEEVQALIARGTAALRAQHGAEARAAFTEGLKLADAPPDRWRMHLGLALAHELTDAPAEAAYAYRAFLRESASHPEAQSPVWQKRQRRARGDLARLEHTILGDHAKVDLQTDPRGASIVLDGEPIEQRTPAVVYLLPGPHRIEIALKGHEEVTISLVLEHGQAPLIYRHLFPVTPSAAAVPPPAPVEPPATVPPEDEEPISLFVPAAMLAATAGAALLSAGLLHGVALREADEVRSLSEGEITDDAIARDNQLRERIAGYQRGYAALYAIGGAAAATAAAMLIYQVVVDAPERAGAHMSAWVGRTGGGLSVSGTF
jgi:hypothetical protein